MKKSLVMIMGAAMLLSSCGTYQATGTYTGAQFGHVIGSAIGGISGGWRGHEMGSLIGTVGGAVVGSAIGAAADRKQERKYEERRNARPMQRQSTRDNYDDRITFNQSSSPLEIRNACVYEKQRDGVLTRGEECTVVFEIYNSSDRAVYDVYPLVEDVTGNKHISISPNLRVESIGPRQAIRYTATILADRRLKDGQIEVTVGVAQGRQVVESQTRLFTIPTAKAVR